MGKNRSWSVCLLQFMSGVCMSDYSLMMQLKASKQGSQHQVNFAGELLHFLFFFPVPLVCYLGICACKISWKFKMPNVSPLSLRKYCSWNSLSVVSPLILWHCDVTIHHHVTHLQYVCLYIIMPVFRIEANLKLKTLQSRLETQWAVLAQACVCWPFRADWVHGFLYEKTNLFFEH